MHIYIYMENVDTFQTYVCIYAECAEINLCSTVTSIPYIHVQYLLLPIYLHIIVSSVYVYNTMQYT